MYELLPDEDGDDIMMQRFKKSLLFVLFGCTLLFQNAASAKEVDWNSALHLSDLEEYLQFIRECNEDLQSEFAVVFDDMKVDEDHLFSISPIYGATIKVVKYDGRDSYVTGHITHSPGERVAYAYLNDDTSFLNDEELHLYNEAVRIVDKADAQSTLLQTELYIHDLLANRITYDSMTPIPHNAPFIGANGAILNGKANCQGYTDAFVMLARMCGIDASKISGRTKTGPHSWAVVYLDDSSYFVDVTFDDDAFNLNDTDYIGHIYFNAPRSVISGDHFWDPAAEPPDLQEYPDENYYYTTSEHALTGGKYFGMYASTAEEAFEKIADNTLRWKLSYVMCPYDEDYMDSHFSNSYLLNNVMPYDGWISSMDVTHCGEYMFFTTYIHH